MTEFDRTFIKNDPRVMGKLLDVIIQNHKPSPHTEKVLKENSHIKDFCEEARHFAVLKAKKEIYLHYDVASWFKKPNGVRIKVEAIGIYDDFMEYEIARLKALHQSENSNIPNIN